MNKIKFEDCQLRYVDVMLEGDTISKILDIFYI